MPLKIKIDSLEGLDQSLHDLYTKQADNTFLLTGVEGLKTQADLDKVTQALVKERADHKAVKEKYSLLGDQDPVDLLAQLDRIKELEAAAAGKIDDKKLEEIVEGRLRTKLGPIEREANQLKTQFSSVMEENKALKAEKQRRIVHDAVRAAATTAKVLPGAVEDALVYADSLFEITEDGRVVTRDQVGVTPGVDPTVWLTEMQQKKSHWWPASQSGGASGSGSGSGGFGENPWTFEHWNMTKQAQILTENPQRAEQMARSAGTTIGGGRPRAKAA